MNWTYQRDPMDYIGTAVIVGCILLIVGFVVASCNERAEWEEYRDTHGCKVTGRQRLRNHTSYPYKSMPITTAVAQDEWLCRDGETFWRESEAE